MLARSITAKCLYLLITWRADRGSWGLAGKRPVPRTPPQASIARMARLPSYPHSLRAKHTEAAPVTRRSKRKSLCLKKWLELYLKRPSERFYRRALNSTIANINISIIITNIDKRFLCLFRSHLPSCGQLKKSRRTSYTFSGIYNDKLHWMRSGRHYSRLTLLTVVLEAR